MVSLCQVSLFISAKSNDQPLSVTAKVGLIHWYIRCIKLIYIVSKWLEFSIFISKCKNEWTWIGFNPASLCFVVKCLYHSTTRAVECLGKICPKSLRRSNCCYDDNELAWHQSYLVVLVGYFNLWYELNVGQCQETLEAWLGCYR